MHSSLYKSFKLIIFFLIIVGCQSGTSKKDEETKAKETRLVILPTIEDKIYEQPSAKSAGVALVQPQELLEVTDTSDFFFYKVKLSRANSVTEGYMLKASFAGKPYLTGADSIK